MGKSSGSSSRYDVVINKIQRTSQRQYEVVTPETTRKAPPAIAVLRQAPSSSNRPAVRVTSEPGRASAQFITQQIAQQLRPMQHDSFSLATSSYNRTLELTAVVPGLQGVSERLA
ncbi:hypothetical protein [Sneathiella sp.]|uniref:hypothetical protein n=1 Tax=Sneathiella sp. TaxID=1964365 RepID=UPI0035629D12